MTLFSCVFSSREYRFNYCFYFINYGNSCMYMWIIQSFLSFIFEKQTGITEPGAIIR